MTQNLIFGFFLEILLQAYNFFYIRQHALVDIIRVFIQFQIF